MSRFAILGLSLLISPGVAWSQQQPESAPQPVRIVITKVDCTRLLRHVPSADVAYRPGVDAKGRSVAPADLPGSGADAIPNLVPDVLEFPITINPISYGARNQAQRAKAAAAQGSAGTYTGKKAAEAQVATLTSQKTTLTTKAATLANEKTALDTEYASAASALAAMQAEVDAGTRRGSDPTYVHAKLGLPAKQEAVAAKQRQIEANSANLASVTSAIAAQQAIVDAAPAKSERYSAAEAAADAKLAQISSRGLDATSMKVGTVRYDVAKGVFTFNDQPLGDPEQQELAAACRKQGVR